MIVRAGAVVVESRLGSLHVDRALDAAQVELVCDAIERVGWEPRFVVEVELTEAYAHLVGFETDEDGKLRPDVQRVRRVTYSGRGEPIVG